MAVLTGSLDGGAKEGGLIVILGFQAKEHFLWMGVEPSGDRVSLKGSGLPQGKWRPPNKPASVREGITHKRGTEGASSVTVGQGSLKNPKSAPQGEKSVLQICRAQRT